MKQPSPVPARSFLPLCMLLCMAVATPARADERGNPGRVIQLQINTPGSDSHAHYHGAVTLDMGGTGMLAEYRWGGSSCPGVKLTDPQIDLLMTALVERNHTQVIPKYTPGEAGTRCLVGFVITAS